MKTLLFISKFTKWIKTNARRIAKVIIVISIIFVSYKAAILIYESPELYMIQNYGLMREFASEHKEATEKASVEVQNVFFSVSLNKDQ